MLWGRAYWLTWTVRTLSTACVATLPASSSNSVSLIFFPYWSYANLFLAHLYQIFLTDCRYNIPPIATLFTTIFFYLYNTVYMISNWKEWIPLSEYWLVSWEYLRGFNQLVTCIFISKYPERMMRGTITIRIDESFHPKRKPTAIAPMIVTVEDMTIGKRVKTFKRKLHIAS